MVQDAVQDRRGNDAVAEHLAPGAEALVGGEDHGAFLIAPADELEELVGAGLVDKETSALQGFGGLRKEHRDPVNRLW